MQNPIMLDKTNHNDREWNWQRYRARVGAQITPIKDSSLEINLRAVWEFRNYCKPEARGQNHFDEIIFDRFNVKWTMPVGDAKLTTTIGRQDIIKGGGWLVLDGTPLDGSRTIFFDAARFEFELPEKKSLDLIYIYQTPNSKWLPRISAQKEFPTAEQIEQGIIAWYTDKNKPLGFFDQTDAYFIYKQCQTNGHPSGIDADLYTFGVSGVKKIDENWTIKGEIAGQFGRRNGQRVCALASNNRLTYSFNDSRKTKFHLDYEYLSGDKSNTSAYEGFDVLWGRWPRVSEVYAYTMATEAGRPADITNLHRVALLWETTINPKVNLCGGYHLFFAPQTLTGPGVGKGNFRGQLFQARMNYKINEHVSGHLMAEYFIPGDAYSSMRNDPALMLRYELTFKL
ncbi:MAG: alginate export family protein [Phycisphaerales bacterium]|jgi:hypothetical protein|nr:alginate export family protein [Phycisphaerales bacterium]